MVDTARTHHRQYPMIECHNIWKAFGSRSKEAMQVIDQDALGKTEVRDRFECVVGVQDANFEVGRGEIFCIMGLSGSSKSTLIRHLNRLIEPTCGDIIIDGWNIGLLSPKELRELRSEKTGMVFQNNGLLPHCCPINFHENSRVV